MQIDIHRLITEVNKGYNSSFENFATDPDSILEDVDNEEFFYSDSRMINIYFQKNDYQSPSTHKANEPSLLIIKGSVERSGVSFYCDMDMLFECIRINTGGKKVFDSYEILSKYIINQLEASRGELVFPEIKSPKGSYL